MTEDYYDLLGVAPDASRDEIRTAYREQIEGLEQAERARLNRAWNVLSDPAQRDRYDERRAAVAAGLETDDDGDDEGAGPSGATGARRAAPARRAAAPEKRGAKDGARTPTPRPEPTIELPPGMEFAAPRARGTAIAFDVAVLLLIVILCQQFVPKLVDSNYQKNTDRYNAAIDRVDAAQKRADQANKRADTATSAAKKATKNGDTVAAAAQKQKAKDATAAAKKAEADKKAAQKQADTIQKNDLAGAIQIATGVAFFVALLYTVPLSALTGQTVGKRLRKIKVVRVDGSPVGWIGSLAHYGFPIAVALFLSGFLGPVAGIAALALVLWYLRDRNYQGVHDKLAKTLVVEVPPPAA
jgi:curved DNA-binding protein CbpA